MLVMFIFGYCKQGMDLSELLYIPIHGKMFRDCLYGWLNIRSEISKGNVTIIFTAYDIKAYKYWNLTKKKMFQLSIKMAKLEYFEDIRNKPKWGGIWDDRTFAATI